MSTERLSEEDATTWARFSIPQKPVKNIRLVFHQGSREWELATVDADRRLEFDVRLRVPPAARALRRASVTAADVPDASAERFFVLGEGLGPE